MKKQSDFRETLSAFRDSVTEWSNVQQKVSTQNQTVSKFEFRNSNFLRWALIGTLAGILIVMPFYRSAVERQREAKALEDVVLLEQVNAYLSRSIPETMEPFAEVVSDDGDLIEDVEGGNQ